MKFRTSPVNRPTRVLAALVVLSLVGCGLVAAPLPGAIVAGAIALIACAVLGREAFAYGQERWRRRDRYDLTLLDDTPHYAGPSREAPGQGTDKPDWETEEGDAVYCHRCDVSMPTFHSICPKCGCPLGH